MIEIEFYPQIKQAHIALVLASASLFALRGALVLAGGARLARALPLRIASWSIDTALLSAALMLLVVLKLNPLTTAWLAVKLLALVVYVGLGHAALRSRHGRRAQAAYLLTALATFAFMYSVARSHHPLGIVLTIFGSST